MFFSVIIPLYNKAPYVEKALRSVAAQTFSDYELIVVDDGSKDESASVAERVLNDCWLSLLKPQPVKLIRQANAGVSTARNNGVAASQGEYVCFLDADDWWEPTFLEEMAKLIAEFPDAGIYGTNYTIINETKHKTRIAPVGIDKDFVKGYINYCKVFAATLAMPLWTGAVSIPRNIFDEMKGFKPHLKLGEDFNLWIRIALRYKVVFLNKPLANYNQDVDVANRGTHHLYEPEQHELWSLEELESFERTNADYKRLIDKMRVNGLLSYFMSAQYHEAAVVELKKVDWSQQSGKNRRLYRYPIWYLKVRRKVRVIGSQIKMALRSWL